MRLFITGGTGLIGSAVIRELLNKGHEVLGLARSEASEQALIEAGASTLRGSLDDLDSLQRGAGSTDGVIHTAFVHDFTSMEAAAKTDQRAIEAIGEALSGTGRPFIVTSGIPIVTPGKMMTENDDWDPTVFPRLTEAAALPFVERDVQVSAIRPPRSVHGEGDTHGFIPGFINIARKKGVSAYVGDGSNRWQAVHRLDLAPLYCLALEKATAGSRYQAVAEMVAFREIAEAIGRRLNVPVVSIPEEGVADHFGFLGQMAGLDMPASSEWTRKTLDWHPTHPSLLEDLSADFYFTVSD